MKFRCLNLNCGHIFTAKKRNTLELYRCPKCGSKVDSISKVKIKREKTKIKSIFLAEK
jgi:DNA-directed RNA polymerase subunit RPC12/RpoP